MNRIDFHPNLDTRVVDSLTLFGYMSFIFTTLDAQSRSEYSVLFPRETFAACRTHGVNLRA